MAVDDSPFGNGVEIGVGFSDVALVAVSFLGFIMLASTLYSIMMSRWKSLEAIGGAVDPQDLDYDAKLDHADVATLNRAQRRARAKNIMKRQRRVTPAMAGEGEMVEGDEGDNHNNHQVAAAHPAQDGGESDNEGDEDRRQHLLLSRKERDKAAKAAEREERKRFEEVRKQQQLKAQEEAQREKRERERMELQRLEEQRKLLREQKMAQEQAEYLCWKTFLSSEDGETILTVKDWIQELRLSKSVVINDLAERFNISSEVVVERIRELQQSGRVQGILDRGRFIAVSDNELKAVAKQIKERGILSLNDLAQLCTSMVQTSIIPCDS